MRRLLPYPMLSLALFGMWVLLTGFSPGHVVVGALVGVFGGLVMRRLSPEQPRIRFGWAMVKLTALVVADIVRSNIAVGRIILFGRSDRRSGFIQLPITLHSPYALAALVIILTATPGTLWLQHDARSNTILIHVLDLVDEDQWIELIKTRYETLLKEIFE
ncbi:multisubunit potassium/proton antiporter, PhaE subunit [Sphingomonas laterariae]|uniref:Multisubunit potassium/proton antiporter, PhaE subunit n=1 Tax=Edaphosphingomonas laterariae TaxID=861865 RepID=A0A239K312_9SPHN|nr:Na+/H+ antiporter subunit E [Sphingomonas laterariae]SNT12148.1 multisubunit potassium/proton antiporter, PhaE subunit [Sphingomonas laterariae]